MEKYFKRFRDNIIGIDQTFESPFGRQKIVYADWIASGRLYGPIERTMMDRVGPFVANTHTEITVTGSAMTGAYHMPHEIIKAPRQRGSERRDHYRGVRHDRGGEQVPAHSGTPASVNPIRTWSNWQKRIGPSCF